MNLAMTRARHDASEGRRPHAFLFFAAYTSVVPTVVSVVGIWFLPEIVALSEDAGAWAMPLYAAVTAGCLVLGLMPATVMAALAGALFGPSGLAPAVVAYLFACVVVFEAARRFLQPTVQAAVGRSPRARAVQAELERATLRVVILSRLTPALPFALMNLLLGASPVPRATYLLGTALGMLPRTLAALAIGASAQVGLAALREGRIPATGDAWELALAGLAAVGTVGLAWYVGRAIWRAWRPARQER